MTELKALELIEGRIPQAMVEEMNWEDCWTRNVEETMGLSPEFSSMVLIIDEDEEDLTEDEYEALTS